MPSPEPKRIFELRQIRWLLEHRRVVICAGGGGIPTAYQPGRQLVGVEAVIDKDRAAHCWRRDLNADVFVMATDADAVYLDWGKPTAAGDRPSTPGRAPWSTAEQFAAGSMGPKVAAACDFARASRRARRGIGGLTDVAGMLDGTARHDRDAPTSKASSTTSAEHAPTRGGTTMAFGVHSEVGKLRKVMVHRPGLEHTRLTPSNAADLLFDDVIWVERAKQEHDALRARSMRERGVEVFEVEDALGRGAGQAGRPPVDHRPRR